MFSCQMQRNPEGRQDLDYVLLPSLRARMINLSIVEVSILLRLLDYHTYGNIVAIFITMLF